MKIAYLSTFYPFRGGIAQFNALLYEVFKRNNEVKAFTFTRQYPAFLFPGQTQMVQENDNVTKIPSEQTLDSINPLSYISTAKKIKRFKPDLMISKFWMPFFAPSLGWVARNLKKAGTKNISILDNVIPHERRPGDIALTKFFLNQNHGFVVMSKAVESDLLILKPDAQYIYHPHPMYEHFPKGIPITEAREKLNIPLNKKVLLFFGFIRSYKGLDIMLEALKKLPDDYILLVAGEMYGDFSKYREQINKLGIDDKVKLFVRYISDDEVPLFFSAADVCMLPYKSATQSGIVSISYHYDLPVIATDVGGLNEIVVPYDTGIMVDKPEPELIADAVLRYFNENSSEKYKENIIKFKSVCSWESLAENIQELYNKLK